VENYSIYKTLLKINYKFPDSPAKIDESVFKVHSSRLNVGELRLFKFF